MIPTNEIPKKIQSKKSTAWADPSTDQSADPWADPWAEWKPLWTHDIPRQKNRTRTTHDFQEQHSPTEIVTIRLSATRDIHQSKRRIVDARLWDALSTIQQDAAILIARAYETMHTGLGYTTSNWQAIPRNGHGGNVTEAQALHINRYIEWAQTCAKKKISHAMIIDILAFGHSCRRVDRDRRMRTGSARENLLNGLTLYCDLQGWK